MTTVPSPLVSLLDAYERAQGHRAQGGLRALAGFDLQLRSHLADFAEAWAAGRLDEGGALFAEAFSDQLEQGPDRTVLLQVKRSLDRDRLADAAVEFCTIDAFLEQEAVVGRSGVRFQALGRAVTAPAWDAFALPPRHAEHADRLADLLAAGRLLPHRQDPDPGWRLVCALHGRVDDAFAAAREMLDVGLRRGERSAELVREGVAEVLERRRTREPAVEVLLRPQAVQRDAASSGRLHVGWTPNLQHLNAGEYMDRPERLAACRGELDRTVAERDRAGSAGLRVFWIEGRSACGKSVLLVQLMRDLVREGRRVSWLAHRGERVPDLVRRGAELGEDGPEFIVVDDLYDRHGQEALDLRSFARDVASRPMDRFPVVVTCGTPDFLDAFERDKGDPAVRVDRWRLPPMSRAEGSAFRGWYTEWTGRPAGSGPAFGQEEGLVLSMALELEVGETEGFALRFRDRLERAGLLDSLRVPLALNRLYLWTPVTWLTEDERTRLDDLNRDNDFSVLGAEERGPGLLRLTHPHLADALYDAVRGKPGRAWTTDVAEAFGRSLQEGADRGNTARALLRLFAEGHERLAELDGRRLAQECVRIWHELEADSALSTWAQADAWASWAAWAAREPAVRLGVDPLEEALRHLDARHAAWTAIWSRLWRAFEGDPRLRAAAESWLTEHASGDETGWTWVWVSVAGRDQDATDALLARGLRWLDGREEEPGWTVIWEHLLPRHARLRTGTPGTDLPARGRAWLRARPDRPDSNFVWQASLRAGEETWGPDWERLVRETAAWLGGREDLLGWAQVLEELLGLPNPPPGLDRPALVRAGSRWLTGRGERREWSYVWRTLFDESVLPAGVPRSGLRQAGWAFLQEGPHRRGWAHVWTGLYLDPSEAPPSGSELVRAAAVWLEEADDPPGWGRVWGAVVRVEGLPDGVSRERLLARASRWLRGRESRAGWGLIWEHLVAPGVLRSAAERARLLEAGARWLNDEHDSPDWYYVWHGLAHAADLPPPLDAEAFVRAGADWLDGHVDNPSWSHVWQALRRRRRLPVGVSRSDLRRAAVRWLAGRESRRDWTFVWQDLFEKSDPAGRAELAPILRPWLLDPPNRDRGEWDKLFEALLDDGLTDDELAAAGATWVLGARDEPQAPTIALKLLGRHPGLPLDELASLCVEMLDRGAVGGFGRLGRLLREAPGELGSPGRRELAARRQREVEAWDRVRTASTLWARVFEQTRSGPVLALSDENLLFARLDRTASPEARRFLDSAEAGTRVEVRLVSADPEKSTAYVRPIRTEGGRTFPEPRGYSDGEVLDARVTGLAQFGVFVEVERATGLVHHSTMPAGVARSFGRFLARGDAVRVRVVATKPDGRLQLAPVDWAFPDPSELSPGERLRGAVANFQDYGVFVRLPQGTGLAHISDLPPDLAEFRSRLREGDPVEVEVLSIDAVRDRISLTITAWTDLA